MTIGLAGDEAPLGAVLHRHWLHEPGCRTVWCSSSRGVGGLATGSGGQIWMQPYPAGTPRRLTNDLIDYRSSAASADGKSIVSVGLDASPSAVDDSARWQGRAAQVCRRCATTARLACRWNADGQDHVHQRRCGVNCRSGPWIADGSNRRAMTTEGTSAWPSLSRDGTVRGVLGRPRDAARDLADESRRDRASAWSRRSRARRFSTRRPTAQWITFTTDQDGAPSLWRVASSGGTPERVAERLERASLSPSGDRAFGVLTRGSRYECRCASAGRRRAVVDPQRRSAATGLDGIFRWAPNGKGVYFTTAERMNLFSIASARPQQTNVTQLQATRSFSTARSRRDGRTMLVTRGVQARDAFLITNFH